MATRVYGGNLVDSSGGIVPPATSVLQAGTQGTKLVDDNCYVTGGLRSWLETV